MITSDFAAYAVRAAVSLPSSVTPEDVRERLVKLMNAIASECDRAGSTLIGHIKCVLDAGEKGFLGVSVTDASGHATVRGELGGDLDKLDIIINVLLYGLTRAQVQGIVEPLTMRCMSFDGGQIELDDLEERRHHEHGPVPIDIGSLDRHVHDTGNDHC